MGSNLSHTIRTFNRFELKYIMSLQQAEHLRAELQPYLVPDEHGSSSGSYPVTSLYLDSPDYRCYWKKENGKYKCKLRIRVYGVDSITDDNYPVMIEIKQRLVVSQPLPTHSARRLQGVPALIYWA